MTSFGQRLRVLESRHSLDALGIVIVAHAIQPDATTPIAQWPVTRRIVATGEGRPIAERWLTSLEQEASRAEGTWLQGLSLTEMLAVARGEVHPPREERTPENGR